MLISKFVISCYDEGMSKQRLQKLIANAGIMSRRKAEQAIQDGRVKLNGEVVTELGTSADLTEDSLMIDGQFVKSPDRLTTVLMNKPLGIITSKFDPDGRKTVMDLLPEELHHLNPVGRLDFHTEGLLILSNDGQLTQTLSHPSFRVPKIYLTHVLGVPSPETLERLTDSIELEDGPGRFEKVELHQEQSKEKSRLKVTVTEGRNRFVRRMMAAVGHPVEKLKRLQQGPLKLGALRHGEYRILAPNEIASLKISLKKHLNDSTDLIDYLRSE
jgi:23S rRNA pseudouridine2605 synthase